MTAYIVRRLLMLVPVLFGISVLVFFTIRQLPGDPALAILGSGASPEDLEELRAHLRLDDPLYVQYFDWLGGALRGDMGTSYYYRADVISQIESRLPVTIQLVAMAMFLSLLVGIPSGVLSAVRQNSWGDVAARVVNVAALSIPSFWLATLMLLLPSLWWGYAPPIGYVPLWDDPIRNIEQFYMPAIALSATSAATVMRMTRSSVLEVMRTDYVRTARAKGLGERHVLLRHVLKNAMIPVISIIGVQVAILLGGQVVVEEIFALPGIGRLLLTALGNSDYLLVQAIVLYMAVAVVLINLVVDLAYAMLDARVNYG